MRTTFLTVAAVVCLASPLLAEPTRITVRAVSRDAKIIGTQVGGARITIRDAATGEILASGFQNGETGETKRIMTEPHARGAVLYDTPKAAGYVATVDLEKPRVVEVTAEGPLQYPQATQKASKSLLVVPGQHIEGDGVVLEIHGFIVQVLEPEASEVGLPAGDPLRIKAKVTMTCGCPTQPGGMWDSSRYVMTAALLRDGVSIASVPLQYAGEVSTYTADLPAPGKGNYTVELLVSDRAAVNFGLVRKGISIVPLRHKE